MFSLRIPVLIMLPTLLFIAILPMSATPKFPLKVSLNHRYLVDQNDVLFFILGDGSGQSLLSNLNTRDAASVMADRASFGFNAVWVHITISDNQLYGRSNLSTYDGIAPFTGTISGGFYDLSKPNAAYFARIETFTHECLAAVSQNMVVLLGIFENYSNLALFRANGIEAVNAYGRYIGDRYKNFPNIIWVMGNDFQTWAAGFPAGTGRFGQAIADNKLAQAIMTGVLATDSNHPDDRGAELQHQVGRWTIRF